MGFCEIYKTIFRKGNILSTFPMCFRKKCWKPVEYLIRENELSRFMHDSPLPPNMQTLRMAPYITRHIDWEYNRVQKMNRSQNTIPKFLSNFFHRVLMSCNSRLEIQWIPVTTASIIHKWDTITDHPMKLNIRLIIK